MGQCACSTARVSMAPHVHECNGHAEVDEECSICYLPPSQLVPLSCGHSVHTTCLTSWWGKGTCAGLVCPFCRQCTYDCFLELSISDKRPVGYFRQDTAQDTPIMLRKKNYTEPTMVVKLTENARDMGLTGFIVILSEESPMLQEKLQELLSSVDSSITSH